MRIRRVFVGTFLCFAMMAPVMAQTQRVLLVVTAHPDDELFMGPVLARYAREHVKVYLAIRLKVRKVCAIMPASQQASHWRRRGGKKLHALASSWVLSPQFSSI